MFASKKITSRILITTIFVMVVIFLMFFLFKYKALTVDNVSDFKIYKQEELESPLGMPVRLKIPRIGVDSTVESVGVTSKGAMDTPKVPENVAWYKLGAYPGDIGNAVITGHYGAWKNGAKSVFDNLHELNSGDRIAIEDENGNIINFVVKEIKNFDPNADSSEVFSSNDGKAHLNLITCEGTWNKDVGSYSQRRVVFAEKEQV
jgi:LPXTG-site transpeptidase (sortase) family protein